MKNKLISIILAALLIALVSGCGTRNEADKSDSSGSEVTTVEEAGSEEADTGAITETAEQESAQTPNDSDSIQLEEYSLDSVKNTTEENVESIDITGCDTFTQIVDKVLTSGMGYANETICGNDVLLVSSGTYDNLEGANAAVDSIVYIYKDGVPYEIGKVASGGTAYPVTVKDGYLYTGSNHWICKYAIADDKLMIMEHVAIVYDSEGNGTYYYDSEDGGDYSDFDNTEAEKIYDELVDEMMNGTVVNYSTVS